MFDPISYTLPAFKHVNEHDIGFAMIFMGGILMIVGVGFSIATGWRIKNWLRSEESGYIKDRVRFGIAKMAGSFLAFIPFYIVYKVIKTTKLRAPFGRGFEIIPLIAAILISINIVIAIFPYLFLHGGNLMYLSSLVLSIISGASGQNAFSRTCEEYTDLDYINY